MHGRKLWPLMLSVLVSANDPGNNASTTVEDAAGEVLSRFRGEETLDPEETSFLMECVTGASRFRSVCEGAFQGYCDCLKRSKVDRYPMHLVAYVIIFKHNELGLETLRDLIQTSTSAPRLTEYLFYLTDADAVNMHSVPLWLHYYDDSFVSGTILHHLRLATPTVRQIVDSLADASPGPTTEERGKRGTPATSFDRASSPCAEKPVLAKAPTTAPTAISAQPAASSSPTPVKDAAAAPHSGRPAAANASKRGTRLPPAEVREMAHTIPAPRPPAVKVHKDEKRAAPQATSSIGQNAAQAPASNKSVVTAPVGFSFHEREAATRRDRVRQIAENDQQTQPKKPFSAKDYGDVRKILDAAVTVPTTNAMLRREAHTHQQRRAEEERALLELEINRHDSKEFEQWRQEELVKEERQRELQLLERHLAALENDERIRTARAESEKQRRRVFQTLKESAAVELQQRKDDEERQLTEQRGLVSSLREELARNRREAAERIMQEKADRAGEVKRENEEVRRAVKAAEEQRKIEQAVVIQEIRLLRERVRARQAELVELRRNADLGEADGFASLDDSILNRMTMTQLRQELERVRVNNQALEEERRQVIVANREREMAERDSLERLCREQRQKYSRDRQLTRQAEAAKAEAIRAALYEAETDRMVALQQRLRDKRQQRKVAHVKTREAERQRRNESNMRAADDTAMEQEKWQQLERGMVNRIHASQKKAADHS